MKELSPEVNRRCIESYVGEVVIDCALCHTSWVKRQIYGIPAREGRIRRNTHETRRCECLNRVQPFAASADTETNALVACAAYHTAMGLRFREISKIRRRQRAIANR